MTNVKNKIRLRLERHLLSKSLTYFSTLVSGTTPVSKDVCISIADNTYFFQK